MIALLNSTAAYSQGGPVQQGGPITSGHIPVWSANGVVGDGGSAQNGNVREIGINNSGTPFCISDGPREGPYHQLCFGANSLGGGLISFQAYNGAPVTNLVCNVNGVVEPCLLSGSNISNIPGPLSVAGTLTVGGNIVTTGQLQAGSAAISGGLSAGSLSAGSLTTSGNAAIGGNLVVNTPGSVFQQGLVVKAPPGQIDAMLLQGGLEVDGPMLVRGALNATGATLGTGGLNVEGAVVFAGNATIGANLSVDESATIQGALVVGNDASFDQSIVVQGNGTIANTLTVAGINVPSDLKIKSDVTDFKIDAIAALKQMRPVSFHLGKGPPRRGLIADEVQKILPQAVSEHNGVKMIDLMTLVDVLIAANQELVTRVDTLEKKVSAAH